MGIDLDFKWPKRKRLLASVTSSKQQNGVNGEFKRKKIETGVGLEKKHVSEFALLVGLFGPCQ